MINVKFTLRKTGPDQLKTGQVYLICYFNRRQFMHYTSLNALRGQWDEKKMEFRRSYQGWQKANLVLEHLKSIVKNYEKDCILAQTPLDADKLKSLLQGKKHADKTQKSFTEWYRLFMEAKETEGLKEASLRSHRATREHLLDFLKTKAKNVGVDTYVDEVHNRFLAYLKSKKDYHPNYIGTIHKNMKTFFKFCVDSGAKLSPDHARLRKIYIAPKREFLTQEELKKWMALDEATYVKWYNEKGKGHFANVPTWEFAVKTRDAFLFQALTGLRHSDLFRLTTDHLIDLEGGGKALRFVPKKTTSVKNKVTRSVTVGLIRPALDILERYKEGTFLLPVPHIHHYNRQIQYVAQAAGFTEMVEIIKFVKGSPVAVMVPKYSTMTSHMARHTFGTISRVLGIDLSDLKDLMGHSDVRTTQIYDHMANEYKAQKQLSAWEKFN